MLLPETKQCNKFQFSGCRNM